MESWFLIIGATQFAYALFDGRALRCIKPDQHSRFYNLLTKQKYLSMQCLRNETAKRKIEIVLISILDKSINDVIQSLRVVV